MSLPPPPPSNGGLSNWPAEETTTSSSVSPISYGTTVVYSCDVGRNLAGAGDGVTTQTIMCDWDGNWNTTQVMMSKRKSSRLLSKIRHFKHLSIYVRRLTYVFGSNAWIPTFSLAPT